MATETRWWWIRHAPVTTDGGNIYGQTDVSADCSETGLFQGLAQALPRDAIWVASHLRRTHETAAAIRDAGGPYADPLVAHAFAEQHFGEWQGQSRRHIFETYGAEHGFWLAPARHAPPGGESFAEVMERVAAQIDQFNIDYAGHDIVAIGHGGTIRSAIGHAIGLPPEKAIGFVIDNCSLTRLEHIATDGGESVWRIRSINEVLHRR